MREARETLYVVMFVALALILSRSEYQRGYLQGQADLYAAQADASQVEPPYTAPKGRK